MLKIFSFKKECVPCRLGRRCCLCEWDGFLRCLLNRETLKYGDGGAGLKPVGLSAVELCCCCDGGCTKSPITHKACGPFGTTKEQMDVRGRHREQRQMHTDERGCAAEGGWGGLGRGRVGQRGREEVSEGL